MEMIIHNGIQIKYREYPCLKIKMIEVTNIYKLNLHDTITPCDFIFYYITPLWFSTLLHNPLIVFKIYT